MAGKRCQKAIRIESSDDSLDEDDLPLIDTDSDMVPESFSETEERH